MEKSWSQILNNFQTSIPIPCKHYSWAGRFVDICQIISKLLSTIAIQRIVLQVAIGMIGIEIRKDTDNLIDYQCLLLILEG